MLLSACLISGSSLCWKWQLIWVNWYLWDGNVIHFLFFCCLFISFTFSFLQL